MGLDAFGKLGAGRLGDGLGHLRLHHVAGTLLQQGIQLDAIDQVDGVQHVALGLGHFLALAVAHQAVHVDRLERYFAGELQGQHDHPRDPEEDNVEAGDQHAGGMKGCQLGRSVRPAQGGKGPQPRAEPGVEYIFVLGQARYAQLLHGLESLGGELGRAAQQTIEAAQAHGTVQVALLVFEEIGQLNQVVTGGFHFVACDKHVAIHVIPGRNSVAPPQLTRDAPVLQIAHPRKIHVLVVFRHELDVAILHCFDGRFGQTLYGDKPLIGEQRLDNVAGAVAIGQGVIDRLDLLQQPGSLHVGDQALARFETVQAGVGLGQARVDLGHRTALNVKDLGLGQNRGVLAEDIDQWQAVAFAHLIVIEVVSRGNLDAAGTLLHVGMLIGDNGDASAHQGQFDGLTDQRGVARVLGIDRYTGVAEQGFGAGGSDYQVIQAGIGLDAIRQRITEVPELALLLAVLHFEIGDGGVQGRIPVDQAFATVDQPFLIQPYEDFLYRLVEAIVHGEALTGPVDAAPHTAQLTGDMTARLVLPLPHLVDKGITAQVVATLALFDGKLALHQHLGGDTGVVGTYLPQGVVALHTPPADQRIHDGVLERVAHVQAAGDVGRRNHDRVGLALARRGEVAFSLPAFVPAGFDLLGLVGLVHGRSGPEMSTADPRVWRWEMGRKMGLIIAR